ncbi:uncharacterized protein METZ01_LOCUS142611 [marine metagenome]|uniref:Uncharacterized protein n=1 Tax=marine metagenome TaxID=408172 RepID=A0A381ZM03_9ZZZZ
MALGQAEPRTGGIIISTWLIYFAFL